jgi:Arc/MetJ family transcription regulator
MDTDYQNMTKQELIDLLKKREAYHKLLQTAIRRYAQDLLRELNEYKNLDAIR